VWFFGGGVFQIEKPSRVLQLDDCSLQLAHTMTGVKHTFAIFKKSKAQVASAFWKCDNESELVAWLTTLKVLTDSRNPILSHDDVSLCLCLSQL
jgi:hypothetical protein